MSGGDRANAYKGSPRRPTGITIVAILSVIGGIALIIFGILLVMFLDFFSTLWGALVAAVAVLISLLYVSFGLLEFISAWGLLRGKGWAWTLALALSIIWIISCLVWFSSSYIIIVGDAIIIYYLFRPHVKAFFGKGQPTATNQAPPVPPPPQEIVQQTPVCPRCGKPLTYIEQYGRWYCYTDQRYA